MSDSVTTRQVSPSSMTAGVQVGTERMVTSGVKVALFVAVVAAVAAVPMFATSSWLDVVNQALIASIGALALNVVLGHAGLVSVGNAALLGVGGLAAVQMAVVLDVGFIPALLFGGVASGIAGLLIALPSMRIKGLYLAMATLAFHFIAIWAIRAIQSAQVGNRGYLLPDANLLGWRLTAVTHWYFFFVGFLVVWLLAYRALLRGRPGRAWRAIREQTQVASMSGVSVRSSKIWAFVLSSSVIGVVGAAFTYYIGAFSWESYTLHMAILYLAMIIVGGLGSTYGPILGAFLMTLLPNVVGTAREVLGLERAISGSDIFLVQGAIVGLIIVLIIIVEPQGLAAVGRRVTRRFRPASRAGVRHG